MLKYNGQDSDFKEFTIDDGFIKTYIRHSSGNWYMGSLAKEVVVILSPQQQEILEEEYRKLRTNKLKRILK